MYTSACIIITLLLFWKKFISVKNKKNIFLNFSFTYFFLMLFFYANSNFWPILYSFSQKNFSFSVCYKACLLATNFPNFCLSEKAIIYHFLLKDDFIENRILGWWFSALSTKHVTLLSSCLHGSEESFLFHRSWIQYLHLLLYTKGLFLLCSCSFSLFNTFSLFLTSYSLKIICSSVFCFCFCFVSLFVLLVCLFWHLYCLVFPDLPGSVVRCLTLI